jgi:hypothetical protein
VSAPRQRHRCRGAEQNLLLGDQGRRRGGRCEGIRLGGNVFVYGSGSDLTHFELPLIEASGALTLM